MDGVERRQFLLSIVSNAAKAHKAWVEGGDTHLLPEDALYQRFSEIAEQSRFVSRQSASDLERLFVTFSGQWRAFVSAQQQGMDVTMLPGEKLWSAWEGLEEYERQAAMPELKEIEPISQLRNEKVTDRQICLIYGFLKADGSPDFRALREEIAEPGKHTGEGWVAPVNKHIVEQIRLNQIDLGALRKRRSAKVAAANTPAPESIEVLVADGVSASQIAKMKKMPVQAVLDYCKANNLPEPPLNYEKQLRAPKPFDFDKSDARQRIENSMGRPEDREADEPEPVNGGEFGPVGDQEAGEPPVGDAADETPASSVDLDDLPLEEQNQITEACTYASQGMKAAQIAQAMNVHHNTVRALLRKGGLSEVANA